MTASLHPSRLEGAPVSTPSTSLYLAALARVESRGDRMVWVGPARDTPAPPFGYSEDDLHRAYVDSCNGGPSLVELDRRMTPAEPSGPLTGWLADVERRLLSMKGGRTHELTVETFAERGVLTSRVTGSCPKCSDRLQVPVDARWVECECVGRRAMAMRVARAGLPAQAQEAVGMRLRPWRFLTEDGPLAGTQGAERIEGMLADWMAAVVRKERMEKPLLYLTGANQAGKSYTAMRLGLHLCRSRVSVRWRTCVELFASMRGGIDEGGNADDLAMVLGGPDVGVLILDDVGRGGGGTDWYVSKFDALLGVRMEQRRPTIVTSNLPRASDKPGVLALGDVVGAPCAARMLPRMLAIGFSGPPKDGA